MNKSILTLMMGTLLLAISSCDYDAGTPEMKEESGIYFGDMNVLLYTPDHEIEVDNHNRWGMSQGELASDTLGMHMEVKILDDFFMTISMHSADTLTFALPFLEEPDSNGRRAVREIFSEGLFADLYNGLQSAADNGLVSVDSLLHFQELIRVLCDTLVVSNVDFCFGTEMFGNALMSYDREKNSLGTDVVLSDIEYVRKSNLKEALYYIQPTVEKLHAKGLMSEEQIQKLYDLTTKYTKGSMTNNSGSCLSSMALYKLSFETNIKQSEGVLEELSSALYGRDEKTDKPRKNIWLVLQYSGSYDVELNHIFN